MRAMEPRCIILAACRTFGVLRLESGIASGGCPARMDAGLPRVEFETYGRTAPEIRPHGLKCGEIPYRFLTMATNTCTETAIQIWALTAFSEVPKNDFIRRC